MIRTFSACLPDLLLFCLCLVSPAHAQTPTTGQWGDQLNGTFANPVLPGDFSDLDAIRVGDHFYAITSTFQNSPGMVILESPDLVNWRIIGHVVPDLTRISPALNWDRMDRTGRGIWAGAIRFHAGKFWVFFGTPDEGLFLATAANPAGPWSPIVNVLPQSGWDDPCPFWDDDNTLYLVTTHFKPEENGKSYNIHLFRLTLDGQHILPASDRIIHQSRGSEANKLYKIHGLYFHYFSEVTAEGRVPMIERATSLDGPWQSHQILHVHAAVDKEPNQGGLIELTDHRWFFLTHQGKGDWEGRAGVLLPITWLGTWPDAWPIAGIPGPDGIGNMLWQAPKPIPNFPQTSTAVSDQFSTPTLNPAWEWNYQPLPQSWSLTARPGYLRLYAHPELHPGNIESVPNLLTQRAMRSAHNQFTAKLDLSGLTPGQSAGLAHYAQTSSNLAVTQQGSTRILIQTTGTETQPGPIITQCALWLRSTWGFDGLSQWSYSLDGQTFLNLGSPYQLTWAHYRGDRIALFTTNPTPSGYVDADSVQYSHSKPIP